MTKIQINKIQNKINFWKYIGIHITWSTYCAETGTPVRNVYEQAGDVDAELTQRELCASGGEFRTLCQCQLHRFTTACVGYINLGPLRHTSRARFTGRVECGFKRGTHLQLQVHFTARCTVTMHCNVNSKQYAVLTLFTRSYNRPRRVSHCTLRTMTKHVPSLCSSTGGAHR